MPPRRPIVVADPVPEGRGSTPPTRTLRERLGAIRNIPPFLALIWATSKPLTVWTVLLRAIHVLMVQAAVALRPAAQRIMPRSAHTEGSWWVNMTICKPLSGMWRAKFL